MLKKIVLFSLFNLILMPLLSSAADIVGPKECQECHEREYDVWKTTPHFKSYKKVHREKKAKAINKALGVKSMKRNKECVLCHYTVIKNKPKAGPSCESCHGAASDWKEVHNDYGKNAAGERIKKAAEEDPAHKTKRLIDAEAGGMIASRMVYDIASSCMRCHGLSNPDLSADTLKAMLDNEHPMEKDFEIIKYSQGKIRHRFVPPNVNENSQLEADGLARLFIGGQMAAYAAAKSVQGKSDHPKFMENQQYRSNTAMENLQSIAKSLPELSAFLKSPNTENAHKVVAAMKDKDLSSTVSSLLPKQSDYK